MINVAELDERIDRCLAILADNPHSQVFAALAEAYRRRGDFGRAFSVCKSGLKHHPDYGPAYVVLAKLYLHQKMLPDALNALSRAVELDGPTRVTDVLEAEIQLALGDVKGAQLVVDRLRLTDPNNESLPEIIAQLKELRSESSISTKAEIAEPASAVPTPATSDPRSVPDCTSWQDWANTLGGMQAVELVFVAEANGRILAQYPDSKTAATNIRIVLSLMSEITTQLPQSAWGLVGELRIETGRGDVWVRKLESVLVGLVGRDSLKFSPVRQRGLDLAGRVQNLPASAESAETTD